MLHVPITQLNLIILYDQFFLSIFFNLDLGLF